MQKQLMQKQFRLPLEIIIIITGELFGMYTYECAVILRKIDHLVLTGIMHQMYMAGGRLPAEP